jgi:hypothetical protein
MLNVVRWYIQDRNEIKGDRIKQQDLLDSQERKMYCSVIISVFPEEIFNSDTFMGIAPASDPTHESRASCRNFVI